MAKKPYQKTEKWWLISVVLFYVLYNFPGIPAYGDANGAFLHGALTLIPLWICIYAGLHLTTKQRKLVDADQIQKASDQEGN
ncbi:hypothetical protein [Dehalobacterium formicoaceticum]|uniref:Uncharacterized protein n=1 Tax=Dehalobacterium formicoaceticum TaxID=51515 RepID=A0ABT1Y973_9FIRM|nr:hypothetical protein [Dehalobacterium formicoaceticum]MCR6547036.1 hypothetical protein [Dehalobacterium formicoaceticum]